MEFFYDCALSQQIIKKICIKYFFISVYYSKTCRHQKVIWLFFDDAKMSLIWADS